MGTAPALAPLWVIGPRTAAGGRRVGTTPATPSSLCSWLRPEAFEYAPLRGDRAALRLAAGVEEWLANLTDPRLVVRQLASRTVHRPTAAVLTETAESGLLWVIRFEVPLEIVEGRQAAFTLSALNRIPVALPNPHLNPALAALLDEPSTSRLAMVRSRRCLAAISAGVAVATSTGAFASAAAADTAPITTTPTPAAPTAVTPSTSPAANSNSASAPNATAAPKALVRPIKRARKAKHATATHHSTPTAARPPAHAPKQHTQSLGTALTITRSNTSATCKKFDVPAKPTKKTVAAKPTKPAWHKGARTCVTAKPTDSAKHQKHKKHQKKTHHHHHASKVHHHSAPHHVSGGAGLHAAHKPATHKVTPHVVTPTPSAAATAPTVWNDGFNLDPFTAQQLERFTTLSASLNQPPRFLIPIYKAAGRRYHIQWQILAAINAIETNFGRNLSISSAGAMGWMQFMPATWNEWGVAADGDRRPNPYDPRDAIFSAARYLDANGGSRHLRRALFAYNHALWYVDAVLWRAQLISDHALGKRARENGYALPLDLRYMEQFGRTDDGVDIEDAPDGAAVYSMTPGVITAVASDPGGFGPDYPVVLATKGPLAGQYIYYGHVAASLVHVGQRVLAGQPIAVMGHTGDAASLDHGHIEIGFSDASGDPLNHHASTAWTPSGDAMRHVLAALTHAFRQRANERFRHPKSARGGLISRTDFVAISEMFRLRSL